MTGSVHLYKYYCCIGIEGCTWNTVEKPKVVQVVQLVNQLQGPKTKAKWYIAQLLLSEYDHSNTQVTKYHKSGDSPEISTFFAKYEQRAAVFLLYEYLDNETM